MYRFLLFLSCLRISLHRGFLLCVLLLLLPSLLCFASAFDGEITTLYPEKAVNPIEECYSDDMIRFIPAARATEMFKMAYASPEELLDEFKENATLSQLGLSEDFDWWSHLVSISGTTFC